VEGISGGGQKSRSSSRKKIKYIKEKNKDEDPLGKSVPSKYVHQQKGGERWDSGIKAEAL